MGYHQAGFDEIVGVDIEPQPNYPFTFVQGDALDPPMNLEDFDLIHASPPCQAYSDLQRRTGRTYPDLIPATRNLLRPYPHIIENVEGAPLIEPVMLCGVMFPELRVIRHRLFESSYPCYGDLTTIKRSSRMTLKQREAETECKSRPNHRWEP